MELRCTFIASGMGQHRPTEHMEQLLQRLQVAFAALAEGKLDEPGLDAATQDAQALYERLVVLRHKLRERTKAPAPAEQVAIELPAMRLDTRPAEDGPRQTSLIDAIAESEQGHGAEPPVAVSATAADGPPPAKATAPPPAIPAPEVRKAKAAPAGASLGERLENAPVNDLNKAIALSQKFWFVAELFDGQREQYEQAIATLNAARSAEDAREHLTTILGKARHKPDPEAVKALQDLIDRRFA